MYISNSPTAPLFDAYSDLENFDASVPSLSPLETPSFRARPLSYQDDDLTNTLSVLAISFIAAAGFGCASTFMSDSQTKYILMGLGFVCTGSGIIAASYHLCPFLITEQPMQ